MSDAPTLLPSHDVSAAPQLRSVCSPCHLIPTNPHNTSSIRSLSALKIMDRLSCYATGFTQTEANKTNMAALFGRFGEVTSIRLIQNRHPFEAYIRFSTESAALRAIAWCSAAEQARMSAAHGYNKYCIKFINNKPCRKDHCPNQHQWVAPADVIERTTPAQQPKKSKKTQKTVQNAQRVPSASASQWNAVADLQQRFGALQTLFSEQNSTVQCLLSRVKHLKQQNEALRVENGSLSQAQKPKLTFPMSPMSPPMSPPMSAKGAMSHGLSQNIIDNDMAELVDFVISQPSNAQPANGYGYDAFVDNRIYHSNQNTPPMPTPPMPTQNINTQRWQ